MKIGHFYPKILLPPEVLGDVTTILREVRKLAADELEGGSLQVIHGDLGPAK